MSASPASYADLAGPPFVQREPIATHWREMQRELYCLMGADFDGAADFCDVLAINILVAAMLSEAARVARLP